MILFLGVGFIFGSVLGSFTEAAANRILEKESLLGRSYCPHCKKTLRWYDLFPILSYLWLKGKCRNCHKKIPRQDFLLEIILGLVVALVFVTSIPSDLSFLNSFSGTALVAADVVFKTFTVVILAMVFLTDLKSGLIPDRISFPATALAVLLSAITCGIKSWFFYESFSKSPLSKYLMPPYSNYFWDQLYRVWEPFFWSIVAAFAVSAFFILLIVITRGRGMGWGDVKYVFFLGLVLGFPNIIPGIFLAFLLGAVMSLILVALSKKHFGQTVPFGPFLSLGAFITLLWGTQILNWYFNHFMLVF
jgi:prepilin signal peptidase PulO-like enzyme (type II secretory pathway)